MAPTPLPWARTSPTKLGCYPQNQNKLKKPELFPVPEHMLCLEAFSTVVLRVVIPFFLYSVMGGQSLCPVSRELPYSTFPAMQEAPTSGGEPRKMM